MRQFFKFMLASCLGIVLFFTVLLVLGIGMGLSGSSSDEVVVKKNAVLEIKLEDFVPELTNNVEEQGFSQSKTYGLHDLVYAIEAAADDKRIQGIVINTRFVQVGSPKKVENLFGLMLICSLKVAIIYRRWLIQFG
jgi:protease IV